MTELKFIADRKSSLCSLSFVKANESAIRSAKPSDSTNKNSSSLRSLSFTKVNEGEFS